VDGGGEHVAFGGDRGGPPVPRFCHRVEQGRKFRRRDVQGDRVRMGADGLGDQAARQILRLIEGAALGVQVEAGDIDGPPPADAAQQDFIVGTHGLGLLSIQPGRFTAQGMTCC
jgi:hypothetical protein